MNWFLLDLLKRMNLSLYYLEYSLWLYLLKYFYSFKLILVFFDNLIWHLNWFRLWHFLHYSFNNWFFFNRLHKLLLWLVWYLLLFSLENFFLDWFLDLFIDNWLLLFDFLVAFWFIYLNDKWDFDILLLLLLLNNHCSFIFIFLIITHHLLMLLFLHNLFLTFFQCFRRVPGAGRKLI